MIWILIVIGGWLAWVLSVFSYFDYLWEVVSKTQNPDPELLEQAGADGAPMIAAVGFGWLISILYATPWLLIYMLAATIRKKLNQSS